MLHFRNIAKRWAALVYVVLGMGMVASAAIHQPSHHDMSVRNITMSDGLPTNVVRSIAQDKYGFIWFGTDNGLCRYDGYDVQTFTNPVLKLDQYVSTLCSTDDGMLVGSNSGAYFFSFRTEKFSKLGNDIKGLVTRFAKDGEGNIWVSTEGKGLYCYNPRTRQCRHYPFAQWKGVVISVFVDDKNQVWVQGNRTPTLPCRLNKATNRFEPYVVKSGIAAFSGMAMTQDAEGNLLVGTWNQGLLRLNADGTVEQLLNPNLTNAGYHIHSLLKYSPTELYIGSDDGLILYNLQDKSWRLISEVNEPRYSIAGRFVYGITKDGEGGVWICTFYGGVTYFSPMGKRFHAYQSDENPHSLRGNVVGRFCEDANHRVWVATDDGGLNCYDPATDQFVDYPGYQQFLKFNVHALCLEGNSLWVGTYGDGIRKLNLASGATQTYQLNNQLGASSCYCLFRDSKGRLWATSMDAIHLLDTATGKFKIVKMIKSLAIDIFEDRQHNLWFSTQGGGLWRLMPDGKTWRNYQYHEEDTTSVWNPQVACVRQNASGGIFVATASGLCQYLPRADHFKRIPLHVAGNDIGSIVFNQDEMWLSTNKGIVKYAPGEKTQVYNRFDGLTNDQFQPNAGMMASDGRIYFGSIRGFNAFYPYQVKVNQVAPPVFITSLEIFNQHVEVGCDKLPESLNQVEQVDLSYDDNMVCISFASLSYISPEKNQYAYKLEGFDRDWIYSGNERKATYTNLSAGTYTFRVKATNNDGVWSTQEATLKIEVHPPFWWSLPAKIFYLLLIGYLIYIYTQSKLRKEKRRHQREIQQLNERKEQEVRDARLQFFTMIAHEIRTPVTLIIGPLENLKTDLAVMTKYLKNAESVASTLDVIDRNAHRLLTLVNQLLDFNKVQQQAMQVHFRLTNVEKLMRGIVQRFEPALTQRGAKLEVVYPAPDFAAVIDPEAVTKMISNLMTNANKYTKDWVKLSAKVVDNDYFRIEVSDNGCGVGKDEQDKIFNPFYQARDNKPGTGIGLNIVKNLVEAHHGMVEVQSEEGMGATFVITLPVNQKDAVLGEEKPEGKQMISDADEMQEAARHAEKALLLPGAEATNALPVMLMVDDDEDMRNFVAGHFKDAYRVLTAENGVEACELLQKQEVNLIVSDWMMPEMDGAEFCRRVRQNPATSHIPFVMLTAKTDDGSKTESMNCGADAFIEKPFSMKYLEACIRNLLEMRHRLQEKYSHTPLEPISEVASTPLDNEFLQQMNQLIEDNLENPDLSVVFLAEQLGISRSSLFSKIKALVDVTPNEMIQLVKLKKAASLLKEGKYRVSEVCYMVGFSSPSYFSKCFQKQFGVKPMEFVEQFKG